MGPPTPDRLDGRRDPRLTAGPAMLYPAPVIPIMKPLFLVIVALSLCLPALANVPALKAPEAAAIAQNDLATRGLEGTVYIAEIVYKGTKLLGGEAAHWEVLWSKELDAQTPGRKEFGLKIKMDGTYLRSVR